MARNCYPTGVPLLCGHAARRCALLFLLVALSPAAFAQSCTDANVSTFAELETAINNFNAFCGNGDRLTADLGGNVIVYSNQPTNVSNATTAELIIRNGTLNANGSTSVVRRVLQAVQGNVTMESVLVTGGTQGNGGALGVGASGDLTLINSTVSGNQGTVAGAILVNGGQLTLINTTVTDNVASLGGPYTGVWADNGATVSMANSILANTTDGASTPLRDCLATNASTVVFTSAGTSNLIETDQGCDAAGTSTINGVDPALGPLQDNGGLAHTHAITNASPAFNAGDPASALDALGAPLTSDGRGSGFGRFGGASVDLGAFEAQCDESPTPPVDFSAWDALIQQFNTSCGDGETMAVDLAGSTITYTAQPTNVNNPTGAELRVSNGTLDANGTSPGRRVLRTAAGKVTMENVLATGGTLGNGGALDVAAAGHLTLINSTVSGNQGTTASAILVKGGVLTLINTTVTDNVVTSDSASSYAGVWADDGGTIYMANSILANTTDSSGTPINDCLETDTSEVVFTSTGSSNLIERDWEGNVNLRCDSDRTRTLNGVDPALGPLADNGGQVFTAALGASSPAINRGDNSAALDALGTPLTNDARGAGFPRVVSTVVDLGAFESTEVTPVITALTIPNTTMRVGDTVVATISVVGESDDYSTGSGGIVGTIAGFAVTGLTKINDTTYAAQFTIADGGTDYDATSDLPVSVVITDSIGVAGPEYTQPIVQGSDAIYANLPEVTLSASPASIPEADGMADIIVQLDREWPDPVSVGLAFTGTAIPGVDYVAPDSVAIPPRALSTVGTLLAVDDMLSEGTVDETIVIDINFLSAGTEGTPNQQTIAIVDDEALPRVTLSVSAAVVNEDGGTVDVLATLDAPSAVTVTVDLAFSGTATAGTDYVLSAPSISIPAGMLTGQTTAIAQPDTLIEGDESLVIDVSSVTNAAEDGVQQQTVNVQDADAGSLSVDDVAVIEGESGTVVAEFTVTADLGGNTTDAYSVQIATQDGTATTADSDYVAAVQTLAFTGTALETKTFSVTVNGDNNPEPTENFSVVLSDLSVGSRSITLADPNGLGTITTDETASIAGSVFVDQDADGTIGAGEIGIADVTVFLDDGNGTLDAGEPTQTTSASGDFSFPFLAPGSYNVAVDAATVPPGLVLVTGNSPLPLTLADGQEVTGVLFGYQRQSDLSITKTDGLEAVSPGTLIDYIIVVTNEGNSEVQAARVLDELAPELSGASWTCDASPGAFCEPSGSGIIDTLVDLPVGGEVVFTLSATATQTLNVTIQNTAIVTAPDSVFDPDTTNNADTDLTFVEDLQDIVLRDGFESSLRGKALDWLPWIPEGGEERDGLIVHLRLLPSLQERYSVRGADGSWIVGDWKAVP